MIINFTHKFIFVHIPKAAGTAVTSALQKYTEYRDLEIGGTALGEAVQPFMRKRFGLYKHATAAEIRAVTGDEVFSSFFTFSFVRNPFTRLESSYHFLKSWNGAPIQVKDALGRFADYETFLESRLWKEWSGPDDIFLPQTHWTHGPKADRQLVDFVGKVEDLSTDFSHVLQRLEPGGQVSLGKKNASPRYRSLSLPKDLAAEISDHYRSDFESFNYPQDPPD